MNLDHLIPQTSEKREHAPSINNPTNSPTLINPDANIPHKARLGRCYELTGKIALHNPHVDVIHGSIQGMGAPRIRHAWVALPDGSIWEPVTNKVWSKKGFYDFFSAIDIKRYPNSAYLKLVVEHEHWGAWN